MKFIRSISLRSLLVFGLLASVACAVIGFYVLKLYVRPAIKEWRIERFNHSAREFLNQNDPSNALLLARRSLQSSQDNAEAWQIAAFAAKKLERPEAVFYQDNLCRIRPSKDNYIELLRLAVAHERDGFALDVVKRAAAIAVNDPEYYQLAAKVYLRQGRVVAAKYFLISLT